MAYVNLQDLAFEAFTHIEKKQFKDAEIKLNYLLNIKPDDPVLYYYLGCLYLDRGAYAFAAMAFEKALTYQPHFDECLNNIGTSYRQLGQMQKCIDTFTHAIMVARSPEYLAKCNNNEEKAKQNLADYIGNLGSCFIASGTPDKAIKYLEESVAICKRPNAMWNLGLAYLEKGEYAKGFDGYFYGMQLHGAKLRHYVVGENKEATLWDGPVAGKKPTVVVYGEQGIGDEIMFASMIPEVARDTDLIFECHPRLIDLFRQSFPDIAIYGTRKAKEISWLANHKVEHMIPLSQISKYYRKSKDDFPGIPYLKANPKFNERIMKALEPCFGEKLIGLSWKGGIGITNKAPRCIPMQELKPLFDLNAKFISLQYHVNARQEVDEFNEAMGYEAIIHFQDIIDDYDLTAALLMHLDKIVSVPQSVIHLAGALGVSTIQMCPVRALWQMGPYGENAPWYECVTNIWQEKDGVWDCVIERAVKQLKDEGY